MKCISFMPTCNLFMSICEIKCINYHPAYRYTCTCNILLCRHNSYKNNLHAGDRNIQKRKTAAFSFCMMMHSL